ncbi:beta-galactosidase trimerization domain-containing protein [Nonomuraea sp. NPDC049400]|uniref:beta-galactosidase n=1 Tax=Nonomuraea sp. NPDC049400 TaxID=3364352 RepID=UPI003796FE3E
MVALGSELGRLAEVATARTQAEVALVWDWQNWWAVEGCAHPVNTFDYVDTVARHHRALWNGHVAVDVVTLDDDLSPYRVLVIPNQYMMSPAQTEAVRRFVAEGGHLLASFFSGIVNEDDEVVENGYPGALREVIGVHVREFSPLLDSVTVRAADGQTLLDGGFTATCTLWQDDMAVETARPLAVYDEGYLAGQPAIVDHELGQGHAVYLGTRLDDDALETLVKQVLDRAGVRSVHAAPRGVEVAERRTATHRFLFLLNHRQDKAAVVLDRSGVDLITGRRLVPGEELVLDAADVAVVQSPLIPSP